MPVMSEVLSRSTPDVRRPIIVELVGLPGAGKTTIARAVIEELVGIGYRVGGRSALQDRGRGSVMRMVLHHARNPGPILAALLGALATRPFARTRLAHALKLADWSYRLRTARARQFDVVVLDQGMVQEGWSVSLECLRPALNEIVRALRVGIRKIELPVALVHIRVAPAEAHRRLVGRPSGGSRFDAASRSASLRMLEATAPRLQRLIDRTIGECEVSSLVIDATHPVARTAREIITFVRAKLEPPTPLRRETAQGGIERTDTLTGRGATA